jgi:hypothetical protein
MRVALTVMMMTVVGGGVVSRAWAEDHLSLESLNLEAHGFVSFGYLRTWKNNWLANDTIEGTDEFYEAALNVVARPWDRVRIGAQLFVRDLGQYDNGAVQLDWAYVDVRLHAMLDVQAGRVKIPIGLYSEAQDLDVATPAVFLPQSVYPIRLREVMLSVDGAKLGGFVDLPAGGLTYALYGGTKQVDADGSYATYVGQAARITPDDIDVGAVFGGMLHWHTPVDGLGIRLSTYQNRDVEVDGQLTFFPFSDISFTTDTGRYMASVEWESHDWTIASEYLYLHIDGASVSGATTRPYEFDYQGGYLSATWHLTRWADWYAAAEYKHTDVLNVGTNHGWSWVTAFTLMPLPHWSLKAELQYNDGTVGVQSSENPQGIDDHWEVIALKTTVDF